MPGRALQSSLPARNSLVVPALVLVLLAAWWGVVLLRAESTVFARVPALDEAHYLDQAQDPDRDLTRGFMSPLYPRLIRLSGSGWTEPGDQVLAPERGRGLRLLQIACWLATVMMLHLTARRVLGTESALPGRLQTLQAGLMWLPSLLFVLYRPASIYALAFLLEIPLVLLVSLLLFLLSLRGRPVLLGGALGLTLGAAALLRGAVLVLLPLVLYRVWRLGRGRQALLAILAALLGVVLILSPAVLKNTRMAGRPAGPTLNGGINLFIGNSPAANGFYVEPVGRDKRSDPAGTRYLAERLGRPRISVAEADSIWAREAGQAMRAAPWRTLGLFARKIWLHLQAWEIDQLLPLAGWARAVPPLRALVLPYGVLVVLGLAGLVLAWRSVPAARWWAWGLGLLVAGQSLFFVVTRYRLVLVPFLCLGVAVGLREVLGSGRSWRLILLLLLILTVLVQPWGLAEVQSRWVALAEINEAQRWALLGQHEDQPAHLERARRLYAGAAEQLAGDEVAWSGWATTCLALGRPDEAEEVLSRSLLRVRDGRQLRRQFLNLLLEQGRSAEALVQVQALLKLDPDDARALHNATVLLADLGRQHQALETARHFFHVHPTDPQAALDLGVLLARAGRISEAREVFSQGLAANPDHAGLRHNLRALGP